MYQTKIAPLTEADLQKKINYENRVNANSKPLLAFPDLS